MKKPFVKNLGMKISAVLISLVLWFFVTSSGQSELSLDVPLEFKNIPKDLQMVSASAKTVSVTVRGQERLMKNIRPSDVRVFADLDKAKKGEGVFYLSKEEVKLPYSIKAINVQPSAIRVKIDETASKIVPVKPVVNGSPEQGFGVSSISLEPKSIAISGLKTEIKKVKELRTESLDISGLNRDLTEELGIDLAGANLKAEHEKVKITITVVRKKR